MLTIVMYHYVRDLPGSRFPGIKGLQTEKFEGQLDYISQHYTVCDLGQVVATVEGRGELPRNACVLTFDDGLADHYETVVPRLLDHGFTGAFFPSARPVEEKCVLDVHKLQFILAATTNYEALGEELLLRLKGYRRSFDILADSQLRTQFAVALRYDPPEVAFVKKLLQWALPEQVRSALTSQLFKKYVTSDETSFSQELYMSLPQLKEMAFQGMVIGGHGYNHVWLGRISREDQSAELRKTQSFLETILGNRPKNWVMCYPFGSYNSDTIDLVSQLDCAVGLTTKVGLTDISVPFELSRLDTNDLPTTADSARCDWTEMSSK